MKTLIRRFSEPSTYAGLSGLAIILGMSADQFAAYAGAAAGVFGFVAIVLGEGGQA